MMSGDSRQAPDFSQSIPAGSHHFNFWFSIGLAYFLSESVEHRNGEKISKRSATG